MSNYLLTLILNHLQYVCLMMVFVNYLGLLTTQSVLDSRAKEAAVLKWFCNYISEYHVLFCLFAYLLIAHMNMLVRFYHFNESPRDESTLLEGLLDYLTKKIEGTSKKSTKMDVVTLISECV